MTMHGHAVHARGFSTRTPGMYWRGCVATSLLLGVCLHPAICQAVSLDPSAEQKLVHPDTIRGQFESGSDTVRVIVNLVEPTTRFTEPEPPRVRTAAATQRYHQRLSTRQAQVRAIQTPVLDSLPDGEFSLRHRYNNWASFAGEVTAEGLNRLAADDLVESIEYDYPVKRLTKQGIALMNGTTARSRYNGQGVAIAIIDDGIDYRHEKLGGGSFPNDKVIGGTDIADNDSDPIPNLAFTDCGHGTNCAGIAAGDKDSTGDYVGGVACGATLYAVKIFDKQTNIATSSDILAAWDWCIDHKLDDPSNPILVVSVSLGLDADALTSSFYAKSASKAVDVVRAGITLVAAAGNDGWCDTLEWPACLNEVISAGAVYDGSFGTFDWEMDSGSCAQASGDSRQGWYATDTTAADKVAVYSNVSEDLDLFAPSNCADTTDVVGSQGSETTDYMTGFGGTSASSPYVAGAVACLQAAAYACNGEYLSPLKVLDVLTRTGDPVTDDKSSITKPRVNLGNAIEEVESGRAASVALVYRFWSPVLEQHFYTIDESERNMLVDDYAAIWTSEGGAYHACADDSDPNTKPVYRFWSTQYGAHFYTISESERDGLVAQYSNVWTYEGIAFWAFPEGQAPSGTKPVYRFWSPTQNGHFYTMDEGERDKLVSQYAYAWTYEGIAWYAYE
ncbi:MAG: S8 family serine peptidase [Solirubrobacterales bacterium]